MLSRRRFIGAAGVAFLAGCSGSSNGDTSPSTTVGDSPTTAASSTTEPTPTPEPTPNSAAETHLDNALDAIRTGGEQFLSEMEKIEQSRSYVRFQTTSMLDQLETAEAELASAESLAVGDQRRVVEGVRSLVSWIRPLFKALDTFDSALTVMKTGNSLIDDGRWKDAARKYETGVELLGEAKTLITKAKDASDAVDVAPIEEVDESDLEGGREAMETLDEAINAWVLLARGFHEWLVGIDHLLSGIEAYQGERYMEAENLADRAHQASSDAYAAVQEGESISPDWLSEVFNKLLCAADAYIDASTHLQAAAEAQQQGDETTADEEVEVVQQAVHRCD